MRGRQKNPISREMPNPQPTACRAGRRPRLRRIAQGGSPGATWSGRDVLFDGAEKNRAARPPGWLRIKAQPAGLPGPPRVVIRCPSMLPNALRTLALSLPHAHEEPHFARTSFRVGKKIFATMTANGEEAMVRVLPPARLKAL